MSHPISIDFEKDKLYLSSETLSHLVEVHDGMGSKRFVVLFWEKQDKEDLQALDAFESDDFYEVVKKFHEFIVQAQAFQQLRVEDGGVYNGKNELLGEFLPEGFVPSLLLLEMGPTQQLKVAAFVNAHESVTPRS